MSDADFDDRIALSRERLRQVLEQIRGVLREDLERYVTRESRRAFLDNPAAADALSDQQVAALKEQSGSASKAAADRIAGALADETMWLEAAQAPEGGRSLETLGAVWSTVCSVEGDLAALLQPFGLATDPMPSYKAPAYFVGGRYLPTLAEHYWKLREELDELTRARDQAAEDSVRGRLASRWDEA